MTSRGVRAGNNPGESVGKPDWSWYCRISLLEGRQIGVARSVTVAREVKEFR